MALTTWPLFSANAPESRYATQTLLMAKGTGTTEVYVLEVDPVTGSLPVFFAFPAAMLDFGASATAQRTAAMIGNAAGAAAFGAGAVGAQVLRTTPANDSPHLLATRHEAAVTPLSVRMSDGAAFISLVFDVGVVTAGLRTASILSNPTGIADWGAGVQGAQTLRTTPATDAPHLLATRHEAAATPLAARISDGAAFASFGAGAVDAQTMRTTPANDSPHLLATRHETKTTPLAGRQSNGTDWVDMDSGASTAATPRSVLATRHEAAATPLSTRPSNGTAFLDMDTGASTAATPRSVLATRHEAAATPLAARLGNGTSFLDMDTGASTAATPRSVLATRHEAAATPVSVRLSDGAAFYDSAKTGRAKANAPYRNDYTSAAVTTGAYVEAVASTSATANRLQIFDSSGQTLKLAVGGVGAEVDQFYITPGGIDIDLAIPAGSRVSIRAVSATASAGEIVINFLT